MDEADLARRCQETAAALKPLRGARRRWPLALKAEILAYTAACKEQGDSDNAVAHRLGLDQSTLSRWRRTAERRAAAIRPVAIIASHGPLASLTDACSPLRLITPTGYRVEGLDAETLAVLLRALE